MKNFTHFFRVLTLCLVTLVSSGAWATVQTYQKVTSAPTDWSGEYLIVYEAGNCAMNGSLTTLDAVSNTQAVTITDNAISLDDSYSFTIAPMDGGYSIQANSGKYIGNASNSNALTSSDNALANTLSLTADGDVLIVSSGGAYLRYNATSGQTRFRYYKSSSYSNQKAIHLYKKGSVTPPTDELKSLTVSGTPTKTNYYAGDAFDPAGLIVTGTYSESGTKTVTSGIDWEITPETLTAGTTSVSVVAKVGSVESSAYTVNGLAVTEKPVPAGYAGVYTSGEGLLTTEGGTSASTAKVVIDGTNYDAIKAGTGKAAGAIKVTVPAGTKTLHFHALGWNGEAVEITVNGQTYSLTSDTGVSGSSPFTLTTDPSEVGYFTLDTNNATALEITFAATSGNRFVLFGVNAEAGELPTNPIISASNVDIDADATSGEIEYTINNPVAGKTLTATTDATWISNIQVTDDKVTFTTTANTGAERSADITLKYEGADDKVVTVTQAKPVPTYASLAALVAAGEPTTAGEPVNVTLTDEEITKFYVTGSYTNGVYLMVGEQEVEIYCKNVPEGWAIGGTISGTLENCTWKKYNSTWELCPDNWDALSYTAPAPAKTYTITWSVNGATTTEDVEEGDAINFTPATVPAGYTDYAFRGWTTNATVDAEPTYVTEATATENVTYYAVFARKTTTGGAASLTKLDGTSVLADGDKLAIFAHVGDNYYGMKHETISTSYVNYYVLDEEPSYEAVTANDLNWWTLNQEEDNWTLGDEENGYLVNASSNNLIANGSKDGSLLTIAWNSDNGAYTIKNGDRWIGCRSDLTGDNKYKFRCAGNSATPTSNSSCYLDIYRISTGSVTYSDFCTILPAGFELTIGETGYATFYDEVDRLIPNGMTAYYCEENASGSLKPVEITTGVIPAETGVVLEGKAATYMLVEGDGTAEGISENCLMGVMEDYGTQDMIDALEFIYGTAPTIFVFSKKDDVLGFYKYVGSTLGAHKAFYATVSEAGINGFTLDFGGQTVGVGSVIRAANLKAGYDIQGRRINQMQKGINILNGKKIIK